MENEDFPAATPEQLLTDFIEWLAEWDHISESQALQLAGHARSFLNEIHKG